MHIGCGDHLTVHREASRGAGVLGDPAVKSKVGGCADGRINAHVGHHPGHNQLISVLLLQVGQQSGFTEAIGKVFLYDGFGAERPATRAACSLPSNSILPPGK